MYPATLSQAAQAALAILGKRKILPSKTYLAGGSALALHFGHRISVDFDFFTPTAFNSNEVAQKMAEVGDFQLSQKEEGTLLGTFNNVKFSLFIYNYQLVDKFIPFSKVFLASTKDIAAMKLAAIMDRGTKKDFVDMYFLNKNNITIDQAFKFYEKKYKSFSNNLYSLITSLSYFDDAEKTEMPEMLIKTSWEDVKEFFRIETKRLAEKYLS